MKSITITIKTENAAFEDNPGELGRILRELAGRVDGGYETTIVKDINGQTVGTVTVDEGEEVTP